MRASARLLRYLAQEHGIPLDREHVLAHSTLDPEDRDDPGPHFDWDYYLHLARSDVDSLSSRGDAVVELAKALGLVPRPVERPSFKDVDADDPRLPWIETARQAGLVSGYPDGSFRPERAIDRQTLAQIIWRGAKLPPGATVPGLEEGDDAAELLTREAMRTIVARVRALHWGVNGNLGRLLNPGG